MANKQINDLDLRSDFDATVNLAADDATKTWRVTGQQLLDFIVAQRGYSLGDVRNVGIACSVGSNALTVALKDAAGNNPSSDSPVKVQFRNATSATGTPVVRTISGALSVVISSGSTLGHASAIAHWIYVYLIDNSGTPELAVSSRLFDDGSIVSTTAEGAAGGADSNAVMYSTTARSNVACRLIARLQSTQATAGTWATAIAEVSLKPFQTAFVGARAFLTAGQNIATAAVSKVEFNTKTFDTHNAFDVATNFRFTCPEPGFYDIFANIQYSGLTAGQEPTLRLYKNGSEIINTFHDIDTAFECLQIADLQKCVAGDYFEIFTNSGGDTSYTIAGSGASWITVKKLAGV